MRRKKKQEDIKKGAPEWMNTYGDMVTLLLCFFVLLFSYSTIDAQKFEAIIMSFQGSLGLLDGGKTIDSENYIKDGSLKDKNTKQTREIEDFKKLEHEIRQYLDENGLADDVSVINGNSGILLRFKDNVLFDSGKADLKDKSKETLTYISRLLNKEEFREKFIRIEGHTDNVPIRNSKYPSNWELSVSRSSNVVRFLIEETGINPRRISASGYSEYHPVAPNDSPENKAKNRRVDILILRSEVIKDID
ncbi:chemotaxis protein MotB [Alkalithermobacter thermoalcaliphilus JW-YL-7 = DSM 7308]|uniref:Chemotaxis protein MotB n=1 Tax=Alkalithermobacter thermoalcaliphilus JW-YL-7 = DSM 7308 TaxID=1121328 RepID=A0A150FRD6_CLOPD|nr:OmpA/MotB domain protein [[Clostridium] paradoxum JW-YL-7 = DSM 7308]SHK61079.1 chemotaxis protein MotB [[Clostridium] paradoxum JW-YL-7 = DSM 7308]